MPPLKFISINDGCTDGFRWIALDGDEDSLRPSAISETFPDLFRSSVCIRGCENFSDLPISLVREQIGLSLILLAEGRFETRIFTRDSHLHAALLHRLKGCLPEL